MIDEPQQRKLRESLGLSVAALSRITMLPLARISAYEAGDLTDARQLQPVYEALLGVLRAANRVQP